jgi:hypothetical protein
MATKNLLNDCPACGKSIAQTADTCPGCGAKNTFIHPNIEKLIAVANTVTTRAWKYEYKRLQMTGVTVNTKADSLTKVQNGMFVAGFLMWLFLRSPFSLLGILIGFMGFGVLAYVKGLERQDKQFVVDYSSGKPVWQSNDDAFWGKVKEIMTAEPAVQALGE